MSNLVFFSVLFPTNETKPTISSNHSALRTKKQGDRVESRGYFFYLGLGRAGELNRASLDSIHFFVFKMAPGTTTQVGI